MQLNYICIAFFTLYISELLQNDKEKNLFLPHIVKFDLMYIIYIHLLIIALLLWGLLIPNINEINLLYIKTTIEQLTHYRKLIQFWLRLFKHGIG